jgi:hypothetical protein
MIYLLAWGASGFFLAGVSFNIKDWLVWGSICIGTLSLAALVARVRIFRSVPTNEIALASIAALVLVFHAFKPQAIWFHALPSNSYGATWVDWNREIDLQQLRKATEPYRIAVNQTFLGGPYNAAWRVWRIESINGFEPTLSEHYAKFIYPNPAKSRTNRTFGDFDLQSEGWAELNVLYYMTNVNEPRVEAPGWTMVYENFYRIYRNDRFASRFRLVGQTCDRDGTINIRSQRTSGWRIDVIDACPGTQLSVSENPDLSWVIMINGKRTPWTRPGERFGLLLDLEPGANSVEIVYNAPLLFTSFVIQFIGFIALVAFAVVAWSTARPKAQPILS